MCMTPPPPSSPLWEIKPTVEFSAQNLGFPYFEGAEPPLQIWFALIWFALQCSKSKQSTVSRGYDHIPVSWGYASSVSVAHGPMAKKKTVAYPNQHAPKMPWCFLMARLIWQYLGM